MLAQRTCYTDLAVLPRPPQLTNVDVDPDTGSFFINPPTVHATDLNQNTSITQQAFKPIADVPAYLIRGPDDCTALIGGTVCLTVTYGGYPKPNIKWLRAVSSFFFILFHIFNKLLGVIFFKTINYEFSFRENNKKKKQII